MARYPVRCRRCRARRISSTHPDSYKHVPYCKICGTQSGWRVEYQAVDKREMCDCGGVMGRVRSIRHKTSHPLCEKHPDGLRNQLLRAGQAEADFFDLLPLDALGRKMSPDEPCPF